MTVVVYTKTTCGPCVTLKRWLKSKDIMYEEKNLEENPELFQEMYAKTGLMSVPQTLIGDDVVCGPNFALLAKMLAQ